MGVFIGTIDSQDHWLRNSRSSTLKTERSHLQAYFSPDSVCIDYHEVWILISLKQAVLNKEVVVVSFFFFGWDQGCIYFFQCRDLRTVQFGCRKGGLGGKGR